MHTAVRGFATLFVSLLTADALFARSLAGSHTVRISGPLTNLQEALVIGNGDMAALVTLLHHEMVFQFGKNDIWDSRHDNVAADVVLKHDDLIRYERDYGFRWDGPLHARPTWLNKPAGMRDFTEQPPSYHNRTERSLQAYSGPAPKVAGRVRLVHRGLSATSIDTTLDIARGVLKTRFGFRNGALTVEAFVQRHANVFRLRYAVEGDAPTPMLILEKQPDRVDPAMPHPEVRAADDFHATITQTIPAGFDVPRFAWHLAGSFPQQRLNGIGEQAIKLLAYEVQHPQGTLQSGTREFSLGIATDRDGTGDARQRAIDLAGPDPAKDYDAALEAHERAWEEFWSASDIELGDKEIEAVWYRQMYLWACHVAPHAQAPGLGANVTLWDAMPWHGDYHWNMNVQKNYLHWLPANHAKWMDSYARLIQQTMPTFEYLAKLTFGLDGAYCELVTIPYVPPHRAHVHNRWGRDLAMTGWVGQALWWHWEYTRDRDWLERNSYPYLKKAAQFYWGYLNKYQGKDGDIFPSILSETPGWNAGFKGNRNVLTNLVMFRKAFQWAIDASTALNVDADWRAKWKEGLASVPEVQFGWTGNRAWVLPDKDFPKEKAGDRAHNWWARWAIFPGEHVDGDEDDGLAAAVRNIAGDVSKHGPEGNLSGIENIIPWLRLKPTGAFEGVRAVMLRHRSPNDLAHTFGRDSGYSERLQWRVAEDNYLGVYGTMEMLLQSHGGVLRLFPVWPRNLAAKFRLAARGGFFVTADWHPRQGLKAVIRSNAGLPCRIRWTEAAAPTVTAGGQAVAFRRSAREIEFDTRQGVDYLVTSPKPDVR